MSKETHRFRNQFDDNLEQRAQKQALLPLQGGQPLLRVKGLVGGRKEEKEFGDERGKLPFAPGRRLRLYRQDRNTLSSEGAPFLRARATSSSNNNDNDNNNNNNNKQKTTTATSTTTTPSLHLEIQHAPRAQGLFRGVQLEAPRKVRGGVVRRDLLHHRVIICFIFKFTQQKGWMEETAAAKNDILT